MSKQHTINHFSHNHPLTEANAVGTYRCDGCKLYGVGKIYRCSDCDYDLHEYCATCPRSLINSCHGPDHELSLINGPTYMTEHGCYVCRVSIQGMFYKCKHCSFESHPLCTHVPMHASSPDATLIKNRSLHQPLSPHHYGQGNHYFYPTTRPYESYPYGGHQHHYHLQHQYQHQQHHYMHPDSPRADLNPGPSTPKTKKKNNGFLDVMKVTTGVAAGVATNLLAGTITDSLE